MERLREPMTDKELMDGFVRGDEESFDALVQRHKERLFNVAYRVLYDRQAAEDVVQRVFIRLAERRDELADVRSVQAWLYAATLNLSLDVQKTMRRRKEREKAVDDSLRAEGPREVAMRSELRKELDLALAGLKNSLRIPLILRYLQGLSYEETGEVLGVSSEAVRKRVKRGLQALRILLRARNLALPVAGIKAMLRAAPSEAASANFLTTASSILKAASGTAAAAKAAMTTTAVVKGGLMMSAKVKIAMGIGAAVLLGTAGYLATRKGGGERGLPRAEEKGPRGKADVQGGERGRGAHVSPSEKEVTDEAARLKDALWGRVVDVEGNPVAEATVEAGVFEGDTMTSLVRKTLVRSKTTDANGVFVFNDRVALSRMAQVLKKRAELPQKLPGALHGLVIVTKEGHFPTRREVDFESLGERHEIVLKTVPEVSGRVVWTENGKPIEGVRVVCEPEQSDLYHVSEVERLTDKEGSFTLSVPAEGEAKVWLDGPHTWAKANERDVKVELVPGGRVEQLVFPIELRWDTVLMGAVTNEEGQLVAGAEVFLSTEKAFAGTAKTREDGRYTLWVSGSYSYRSYDLQDWPRNPRLRANSGRSLVMENVPANPDGSPARMDCWIPPANAPPERLVAFHANYEMGIVDVPALGVGQVRENVDIVLRKGSKVSGRVTDENSVPVNGIDILVKAVPDEGGALVKNDKEFLQRKWGQRTIASAEDGSYQIKFLPQGVYEIAAHHPFWKYEWKRLELRAHEVVEGFDFVLIRGDGFIKGKVTDEKESPWPHGKVWAGDHPIRLRTEGFSAEIQKDGSYALTGLEPGKYRLRLEVSGDYRPPDRILWADCLEDVATGTEDANITVKELRAGSLRVRAVDEVRNPVKEFQLECCPLSLAEGRNAIPSGIAGLDKGQQRTFSRNWDYSGVPQFRKDVVSESGEFVEGRVAPGKYFVSVKSKKHGGQFAEAEVVGGHEMEVVFELRSVRRIEGIVRDERGQPVGQVRVQAAKMRELLSTPDRAWIFNDTSGLDTGLDPYAPAFRSVECRADGRFVLEHLEQGDYRIIASLDDSAVRPHGGWCRIFVDIAVGPTEPQFIELVMMKGTGRIEGCVVGENGTRNHMEVALIGNGEITRLHTDATGNYFFEDVLPGQYHVRANIWGSFWARYEGRDIELLDGEHLRVDIVAEGKGGVQGSVCLTGDAARAADWCMGQGTQILLLREVTRAGTLAGRETRYRVDRTFQVTSVRAGTYEARAYMVLNIKPLGAGNLDFYDNLSECRAQFESEPQVIEVAGGSTTPLVLTVSQACAPHYPIPDAKSCDGWVIAQ